jgi:sorbitol-specific phosphotransferase system component IIBC
MKDKDAIQQALETIDELQKLYDTDDIINIGRLCNKMSILTINIGKQVSDAQKLWKSLEDNYDHNVEQAQLEFVAAGEGVAKAKSMATVKFFADKKDVTQAEQGYNRLKRFLDRCDKVLEAFKQYCSTVKSTNLKGI